MNNSNRRLRRFGAGDLEYSFEYASLELLIYSMHFFRFLPDFYPCKLPVDKMKGPGWWQILHLDDKLLLIIQQSIISKSIGIAAETLIYRKGRFCL